MLRPAGIWLAIGVVLAAALAATAITFKAPNVEATLVGRVDASLGAAGQYWATPRVDGRSVILTGTAMTPAAQQSAVLAAAATPGIAGVRDETVLIPLVAPFEWSANRTATGLFFIGFVPDEETREALREIAETLFDPGALDDRTQLARGAPGGFEATAEFALNLISAFAEGEVRLAGADLVVEGLAVDGARYEAATRLVLRPPVGTQVISHDIRPPLARPYVWAVAFDDNAAVMTGGVPTDALGDELGAATLEAVGKPTTNRTELFSGEPAAFREYALFALGIAGRLASGTISLADDTIEIFGRARTPEAYEFLQGLPGLALPAGLVLGAWEIQPSMAEAYVLEVVRDGARVELVGLMPTIDARIEIMAEAERLFGAGNAVDRLQIADGAPRMDWIGAAKFALGQAAGLSGGSARISDHSYSITGAAASSEAYEQIQAALARTLPASLVLTNSLVSAPLASPFRFAAAVGPEALTVTGVVPTPEIRDVVLAQAELRFDPLQIALDARLASGAPAGFREAVLAGLQAISRLEAGRIELADLAVHITGVALYPAAADRIEQQVRAALPADFVLTANFSVKPAESIVSLAECQALLTAGMGTTGIRFTEGSATIAPESEGRLDRLVAILGRCPEARVEIGAYTDSGGTAARNRALSEIRAASVLEYLAGAGVVRDRLTAVGYGEANPIAPNETEEGRARNRRIEFKLLEP